MTLDEILAKERQVWGDRHMVLSDSLVCLGVIYGDLCRQLRDERENKRMRDHEEMMKELGNLISSTVRWTSDLGYSPDECVNRALEAQRKYQQK